jgi:uncharacterized membrane protein
MGERTRKRDPHALAAVTGGAAPLETVPGGPARLREELRFPAPAIHREVEAFLGPIPRPEILREYDRVLPGLAERIVTWTEHEAHHRRTVERSLVQLSWGGLWVAFVLALGTILGGMLLAWYGRSVAGVIGVVGALAGLVIVFFAGRVRGMPDPFDPAVAKPSAS